MIGSIILRILNRKAYLFIFDALLAAILLISALILLNQYVFTNVDNSELDYISKDMLVALSTIKMYQLNNTNAFVRAEVINGNITVLDNSVLEQAGEYWARNQTDKAKTLLRQVMYDMNLSMNIQVQLLNAYRTESDIIYGNSIPSSASDIIASRRMISGVDKGQPLSGSTSSAYLRKIINKKTFSYAYFGGFVGQGNITVPLALFDDYNSSKLISAKLSIETPGNFTLYINNQQCLGAFYGYMNSTANTESEWDVTQCKDLLVPFNNNISIRFVSSLDTAYISGGFFKAVYITQASSSLSSYGHKRYYFPEVDGLINLYDAISAQGIIQNWILNLTFYNNYSTYFNFGNNTLFVLPGNDSVRNVVYSRINQNLPEEPIPIRLGIQNFTNVTVLNQGIPADVFLITDVSGSMAECIGNDRNCTYRYQRVRRGPYFPLNCWVNNENQCNRDPDNPCGGAPFYQGSNYQTTCNLSKIIVDKIADINFINTIISNSSLYRIGLEDFSSSAHDITPLTNNGPILANEINNYNPANATCSCCGINKARDAIISSSNKKFLVFLSDGDPTLYCNSLSDYSGSSVWGSDVSGGTSNAEDRNWTILAGQEACRNNITVYTIGFGNGMSAQGIDTMKKTACNASQYYDATDINQLNSIFQNISNEIFLSANFSSQVIVVSGAYSPSRLYGGSYIDIYYDPVRENDTQNKISITTETAQFNSCNASIYLAADIEVIESFVTSYSGDQWTKNVVVNNFQVYNLTRYGQDYGILGDPFIIEIPSVIMQSGDYNNISLIVGENPTNNSECSDNNTLIYTFLINSTVSRSSVLPYSSGCIWTIEFEDRSNKTFIIPKNYAGSDHCSYTNLSIWWKDFDAYDVSAGAIFKQLDFDNNGRLDINIDTNDLEVVVSAVGSVPYLWGPSIIETRVWR